MQVPTSTLVSLYQTHTKDTSTANLTTGKTQLNYYYTVLLGMVGNYVIERTKYGYSKEDQRSYLLPPDYIKMKTVRWKVSNTQWEPVVEVKNVDAWNNLTASISSSDIPDHWFVFNEQGNLHLELDPIPNLDAETNVPNIEIVYEGFQDPLQFPADYTTGTLAISRGSAAVVGTGTSFTSAMIGRFIQISGGKYWYEVKSVTDTTHLTLVNFFQESTVSGASYTMAEILRIPAEYSLTPLWGACRDYYLPKNQEKSDKYDLLYKTDVALISKKYKNKTKGNVSPGRPVSYYGTGNVPRNYPNSLLTRI